MAEITREKALLVLHELFDKAFGHDKGSDEIYTGFCVDMDLCEGWDGEAPISSAHYPPGQFDILQAAGFSARELVDVLGINPQLFSEMELNDATDI